MHVQPRESARVASGSLHVLPRGLCKYPYFICERVYAYTLPPAYRYEYRAAALSKKDAKIFLQHLHYLCSRKPKQRANNDKEQ